MNTKILLLALVVVALSSCSTAYKMGQTPDDVYFSPAKEQKEEEYVNVEDRQDRYRGERYNSYNNSPYNNSYDDFYSYRNDRMLRMSIGNRMRLSAFDDYYWNDGYNSWKYNNYGYTLNNPWNSYHYWNNFYNPYTRFNMYNPYYSNAYYGNYGGGNIIIVNPKSSSSAPVSRPRVFNPGTYNSNSYSNNNLYLDRAAPTSRPGTTSSNNRYNNSNRNNSNGFGNTMRKIFTPENNGYYNNNNSSNSESRSNRSEVYTAPSRTNTYEAPSRSYEAPSRSYTPSSPAPSSGSSGGGVTRPTRGGN